MATLAPPTANGSSSSSQPSSSQSTRDAFNAALRSRNPNNNYIAHLKIWEPAEGAEAPAANSLAPPNSRKARYLILAVQRESGRVTINKAKRNANGSFSVGKDWDLNTLKEVEVADPTSFTLTLSRPYSWTTDRAREQELFLTSLVNVYRRYTRSTDGPRCVGLTVQRKDSTDRPSTSGGELLTPTSSRQGEDANNSLLIATEASPRRPSSADPPRTQQSSPFGDRSQDPLVASEGLSFDESKSSPSKAALQPPPPRPPFDRKGSSGPRDEAAEASFASSASTVKAAPQDEPSEDSTAMSRSKSSQSTSSNFAPKETLSDRLARLALGSNSNRGGSPSRPMGAQNGASGPSTPTATLGLSPKKQVTIQDPIVPEDGTMASSSGSSGFKPLPPSQSKGSPSGLKNARARLSTIEPLSAKGGKAYERMLLAGTGLKSIGDEDEEEEEDDEEGGQDEEQSLEMTSGLNGANALELDPYGGMVADDGFGLNDSTVNRKKTLKNSKSMRRNRSRQVGDGNDGAQNGSGGAGDDGSDDDDATLVNVEELLEGIDFAAVHKHSRGLGSSRAMNSGGAYSAGAGALLARTKGQGTADIIEGNLLSELEALDSANIHSILNGDDRLASVLHHVDAALTQLESIDSLVATFKLSLNSRAEDIGFIEGQNRGLQVMNANWRALQREIEQLQQTINIPPEEVDVLIRASYELDGAIEGKEAAAASLYKAIVQAKTSQEEGGSANVAGGMAATTERLGEYSAISGKFANKMLAHLSAMFTQVTSALLADSARKNLLQPPRPRVLPHEAVEAALNAYCGLMLYVKEVEPKIFERISASYLTSAAERYKEDCRRLIGVWKLLVRSSAEDEDAIGSFHHEAPSQASLGVAGSALARAGTVRRMGGGPGARKGKGGGNDGEYHGSEAFRHIILTLVPLLLHETLFLSDFLHLNSNGLTFADYMDLAPYFRRRAAVMFNEAANERRGGLREMKGAMDLIFGFFAGEVAGFIEEVKKRDRFQVIGVLAALDFSLEQAEESGNEFVLRTLGKIQTRVQGDVERFFSEQLRAVSANTAGRAQGSYAPSFRGRKAGRGGLTPAVRILPHFVDRIENQLIGAQQLQTRSIIDGYYEQLDRTVIDALISLKVEANNPTIVGGGQDEDKGGMNHQVLLLENMHHLIHQLNKLVNAGKAPVLRSLISRAEKVYEDSLSSYTHFVLRRPLGKLIDFKDGIEALLRSTPANEVSLHSAYSKSSFKKLVKEHTSKDLRKGIDALWRRVLKHFDEDEDSSFSLASKNPAASAAMMESPDLLVGPAAEEEERRIVVGKVWRRCEHDFMRELERMARIQEECYKGTGIALEVNMDELTRLFRR